MKDLKYFLDEVKEEVKLPVFAKLSSQHVKEAAKRYGLYMHEVGYGIGFSHGHQAAGHEILDVHE